MARTITLRVSDGDYRLFRTCAEAERRPLSNLIQTYALKHLEECSLVSEAEMEQIASDEHLTSRLRAGSRDARKRRGRFVP